jgi:Na+/H+-dicarboxylate symporter
MQIYTKILLGMAIGAVIGVTLGPTSALLSHDLYKIGDATQVRLYLDQADSASRLQFPNGTPINLKVVKTTRKALEDAKGSPVDLPIWAQVKLTYTKAMGLRDKDGSLRKALGGIATGDSVDVWLQIQNKALEGGGFLTSPTPISEIGDMVITGLSPLGDIFMRLIKMVIVPLVFSSLLVGVASLGDVRKLGRMGGKTLGLYLLTTAVAVSIGLICAHVINPGSYIAEKDRAALQAQFTASADAKVDQAADAPSALDNILDIIPENPVASLSSGNMLQIIFFALLFGVALTLMGASEAQVVVTFFDKVQQAMVIIIHMVMAVAPYGVAALIAEVVGTSGLSVLRALFVYSLVVLLGLFIHATFVYGGIVRTLGKLPFLPFLKAIRPAQLVAFSTSSSSATLPVSMEVAEQNLGVSNATSSFVLPLGSTVNMDGTALYQGVAAVFIAQVFQIDLSMGAQLGIVLTATMASIGAAGVPGAGMVTLAMVLTATGIPAVGVALILGMDRILDMFRTAVNVTGDLAVTAAMAASEGETLKVLTSAADAADPEHGFEGRLDKEIEAVEPE